MSNTPYPAAPGQSGSINNLQSLLGIGAYSAPSPDGAGNGGNFGQDISEQFVKSLISNTAMNMGPGDGSLGDILTNLGNYIGQLGLDSLKMLQPLIPGATDDDFKDTNTAVAKIMDALNVQLLMSGQEFTQWITDIFDPNSVLWTDAKAKWDALMAQLNSYPPAGSSAATVATWWSTLLVDLGGDPTLSATIANIIAGNYDWAKQAKANWDAFLASWGGTSGSAGTQIGTNNTMLNQISDIFNGLVVTPINTAVAQIKTWFTTNWTPVPAAVSTQQAWWARLPENILISLDGMHVFYPLGSPSDTPTTTVGGKRTWYAAKADMALMQGQANGTATPTVTINTDVGTFAATTQTRVITNESTLAQVQADVDALKTADTSVAGAKFLSSATVGAGASWGSQWTVTASSGAVAPLADIDLFSMTLPGSSAVDLKLTGQFTGGVTLTDDQIVSLVFQDAAGNMGGSFGPQNVIKGRENSAGTAYIFARVNFTTVQLGYAVGGVETVWATQTGVSVPAGSLLELYIGSSTNHRAYQVKVNGTAVITFTETGTSSQMGASYRGGGQDQLASHGSFNDVWKPARVKQFKLQDSNVASSTYGTSARFYRAAASPGILINKGAVQSLGNGVYDTQEYCSPDLQLVSNGFAIFTPGRYRLTHSAKVSSATTTPWGWSAFTGAPAYAAINRTTAGPTTVSYATSKYEAAAVLGLGGSFSFNAVGDGGVTELWAPSVACSGSGQYSILGDGAGEGTWVTIERIG